MTKSELKDLIKESMTEINEETQFEQEAYEFVEENFLQFVDEATSADIQELNKILNKMKVKNIGKSKPLTEEEIKRACKILESLADYDKKAAKEYAKNMLNAFYGYIAAFAGAGIMGAAAEIEAIAFAGAGIATAGCIVFIVSSIASIKSANGMGLVSRAVLDGWYDKMMKNEAKAKANLKKIEGLDDKKQEKKAKKAELLKAIISNCEKLRSSWKKIVDKLDNGKPNTNDRDGVFKECFCVTESGDVELLQEMKGNVMKTELFKQIADDADEVLRARYKYLMDIDKNLHEVLRVIQSVKNPEEAAKAIVDLKNKAREFNAKNKSNEHLKSKAFADVRSYARKFNSKYAFESVKVKKALSAKISKYENALNKIAEKYDGETGSVNTEIFKAIDQLSLSDSFGDNSQRMIAQFETIIMSWEKAMVSMANATLEDCDKVQKALGAEKAEKKILYKLLNMKERKAEKKEQKEAEKAKGSEENNKEE